MKAGEELGGRNESRIRELGLQAMIQATSLAKMRRATQARSSVPGERLFAEGGVVDYFRKPGSKDDTGWHGPGQVTKLQSERGTAVIRVQGRDLNCRFQDLRHTLFTMVWFGMRTGNTSNALSTISSFIDDLKPGTLLTFGYSRNSTSSWIYPKRRQNTFEFGML